MIMTEKRYNESDAVLFDTRELELYLEEIRNGKLKNFSEHGYGVYGVAVLEYPSIDIEVNINSKDQVYLDHPADNAPIISYFCCKKDNNGEWYSDDCIDYEPQVDWNSEDWKQLLMIDMYKALKEYSEKDGYILHEPDVKLLAGKQVK